MIAFRIAGAVVMALALAATPGIAAGKREKDEPAPTPALFQAAVDCAKVADPQARLACYDKAVAAMEQARQQRELAVYDIETMRTARRGIFGLSLPSLSIFKGGEKEEVTEIDSTISAVRQSRDGMAIFVLADGAMWRQTEGRNVFAKAGQPIHIRRAALGSYMANVNKQPGVRVIRIVN